MKATSMEECRGTKSPLEDCGLVHCPKCDWIPARTVYRDGKLVDLPGDYSWNQKQRVFKLVANPRRWKAAVNARTTLKAVREALAEDVDEQGAFAAIMTAVTDATGTIPEIWMERGRIRVVADGYDSVEGLT